MGFVKNYSSLATSDSRKMVLDIIESGLEAIQPDRIMKDHFFRNGNILHVQKDKIDLNKFERVFFIGFGKGSAGISKIVESLLLDKLTAGFVIDTVEQKFKKIHFTLGTHPLTSQENIDFTNNVLDKIKDLTDKDLVLLVICGGGSAMFESPFAIDLKNLIQINTLLLKSGATISEMNIIRKHLSKVKGGGLAKHLYPSRVVSLIFSDVLGNDLSTIASGPVVKNTSTMGDVFSLLKKYDISSNIVYSDCFTETPTEDKYFLNVVNYIMVSNVDALNAMANKAKNSKMNIKILTDRFQGDAKKVGKQLIEQTQKNEILLIGGETTVHVTGNGKGGRNQTLVLAALPFVGSDTTIASIGTDGVDFYYYAGAIGDEKTVLKAKEQGIFMQEYLNDDNSYEFFKKTNDGIFTDRLESNVADVIIVMRLSSH